MKIRKESLNIGHCPTKTKSEKATHTRIHSLQTALIRMHSQFGTRRWYGVQASLQNYPSLNKTIEGYFIGKETKALMA